MILYEFEGKKLLSQAGIKTPQSQLVDSAETSLTLSFPIILKAQVLSGKRADAGGIIKAKNEEERGKGVAELLGKVINKERVEKVLIEQMIEYKDEYYLSISYDTETRSPILTISAQGGTGIEEREAQVFPIDPLEPTNITDSIAALQNDKGFLQLVEQLIKLFFEHDCLLLEINPLVKTESGEWLALDAKVNLEDNASARHPEWKFPPRSAPGHTPTSNEIEAKKIDEGDYRGVAGSAYFDLDGDIAVLASGGGASITAVDMLIKVGGKPANYTEYGGNPPREKVVKLTKVVLNKPNLHGLWVVGALANFTNIFETLSGFIEGLREVEKILGRKIDFPIVIRRAGPKDAEAREMLAGVKDFDLHIYGEETSITRSAEIIKELAEEYKDKHQ